MALGQTGGDLQIGFVEIPIQENLSSRRRLAYIDQGGPVFAVVVLNDIGRYNFFPQHIDFFLGSAGPVRPRSHDDQDVLPWHSLGLKFLEERRKNPVFPPVGNGTGDVRDRDGHS